MLNGAGYETGITAKFHDMTKFRPSRPGWGIFAAGLKAGEERVVAERVRAILTGKA